MSLHVAFPSQIVLLQSSQSMPRGRLPPPAFTPSLSLAPSLIFPMPFAPSPAFCPHHALCPPTCPAHCHLLLPQAPPLGRGHTLGQQVAVGRTLKEAANSKQLPAGISPGLGTLAGPERTPHLCGHAHRSDREKLGQEAPTTAPSLALAPLPCAWGSGQKSCCYLAACQRGLSSKGPGWKLNG